MENMGNILVSDILEHSGVKGMKWGVTAAKSTPRSQARTDKAVKRGLTEKKYTKKGLGRYANQRRLRTFGAAHLGSTAAQGVLLTTGKFTLVKAGLVATSATAATAGAAALVGGAIAGGVVGNRLARKYGKRTIKEIRSAKARGITKQAKKP